VQTKLGEEQKGISNKEEEKVYINWQLPRGTCTARLTGTERSVVRGVLVWNKGRLRIKSSIESDPFMCRPEGGNRVLKPMGGHFSWGFAGEGLKS